MFRTLKSNSPFSAPRDDTARASCGNGAKANSYHYHFNQVSVFSSPCELIPCRVRVNFERRLSCRVNRNADGASRRVWNGFD